MSLKTQTSRNVDNNNSGQNTATGRESGYSRLGYDKGGSLCVLDITYPDGSRKTINKPGNSHAAARVDRDVDLNTSAFPASQEPHHQYPGTFARMGYDNGVLVVLESGNYRRTQS